MRSPVLNTLKQNVNFKFLFLLLPFLFVYAHPTYVSTTTLKYNYDQKSIEITCKMTAHDLEEALKKNLNTNVDVLNPGNKKVVEDMISEYIKNRLSIAMNGKALTFNFIGYEKNEDQAVSFLEITGVDVPQTFEIDNKLLFDHFKGQMNIVNIEVNGKKQSSKVVNPESKMKFTVGAATAKKTPAKKK